MESHSFQNNIGYALRYPGLACIGGGRLVRHHRKSCIEDCKILIQSLLLVYNMCGLQITVGCGVGVSGGPIKA
ncbi:unnamed protein product [Prunus armeniaca]|uniref:Uncharacterized protein n=1 Tax=Prunus armeniaca TaxID=36596 RepID=A0A6J5W303_PRUAR|nr:unnamed protein product [Prunus armeniaca]